MKSKKLSATAGAPSTDGRQQCSSPEPTAPDEHRTDLGLDVYYRERRSVLARSPEFERKGLGTYTAEVGLKCDMACTYCSSSSIYRMNEEFKRIGRTSFTEGFAVIDRNAPDKLAGLSSLQASDTVILCSKTDGWSPVARRHQLGTRMLERILEESRAGVRIITKSSHVLADCREIIARHRKRVTIGVSITGLPEHDHLVGLYERNACPPSRRITCMREAAEEGFRVFAMLCPLFPGLFSTEDNLRRLVAEVASWRAEDIWCEIPNPRGRSAINTIDALRRGGEHDLAGACKILRRKRDLSRFGVWLTQAMQKACARERMLGRLHMLNYRGSFTDEDIRCIDKDPRGVIWL